MKSAKELVNTSKQARLLQVLGNIENIDKSIEERCRLAGISRAYYFKLAKNAKFQDALRVYTASLCITESPGIVHAFIKRAKKGEHKQGETILKMAGMIQDTPLVHITQNILSQQGYDEQDINQKIAKYFFNQHIEDAKSENHNI